MELVFTGEFPPMPGGIGRYAYSRCMSPGPDGLRVLAAEILPSRDWDEASQLDVRRFRFCYRGMPWLRLQQIGWAHSALERELRQQRYRLVTATHYFPFGWEAARVKARFGHRVAVFCHGNEFSGTRWALARRAIFRSTLKGTDLLVANSPTTADLLLRQGCPRKRICVITPPVDTGRFRAGLDGSVFREAWSLGVGPVLLTVGRLDAHRQKGVDTVLKVVALLQKRYTDVRYVVVGDGAARAEHEALARELGVEANVVFAGAIANEVLPLCYAACDIYVMAARRIPHLGIAESFGIVYREAMACGKPVVVSKEAGIRSYIEHGVNGLLADPESVEEDLEACLYLLENPDRASEMGRRGAEFARQPADWSPLNELC